jgi:hypothetical protein
MRAKLLWILVGCFLPLPLAAQGSAAIEAGARVRVWTSELRGVTGRVERATPETLVLGPDGQAASLSIPVATLVRVDVSRGQQSRKSAAWSKARWGILIGAVPGAILSALQHEQIGEGGSSPGEAAALGAWSGGLFGGLIGAAVGAARPGENWERVR